MPTTHREVFLAALRVSAAEPPSTAVAGAPPPDWLWDVATALHENLPADKGDAWAVRLHGLLGAEPRTTGLRAIHSWHADTVLPLLTETMPEEHRLALAALGDLHRAAAQGQVAGHDSWATALTPVLLGLHDAAYDRPSAYAEAHTGARDYALANGFAPAEADDYGHDYARVSCEANVRRFADAHAEAVGAGLARAYATDSPAAYADTCPGAQSRAVVRAMTARDDQAGPGVCLRLADGLLTALGALPSDQAGDRTRVSGSSDSCRASRGEDAPS
ncbi:hypothetical protein FB570_111308 [Streptomyces sp. T12]|uniref:hypothetical protein n=1 Tax=Streptomyces sp. T12 TaxID=477697 RepID=UPI00119F691D|nr:hypothetical protein [Streptomyces sp. T12]TWD17695.1 hypothetical protein FB570_111308 [Streptomyces sp. T12]